MITDYVEKIKGLSGDVKRHFFVSLLIIFVGISAFGLGRRSMMPVNNNEISIQIEEPKIQSTNSQEIFASRNGTRYYYKNCSGLSRIAEENLISFSSIEEAETAGYTLAANCNP